MVLPLPFRPSAGTLETAEGSIPAFLLRRTRQYGPLRSSLKRSRPGASAHGLQAARVEETSGSDDADEVLSHLPEA
ncbi:hypothetical protein SSAG_03937 [Streptomyces sp. Mg1]|nr:hypothetical protein SSAG_03937 [Streptomyces sp. Mg1]